MDRKAHSKAHSKAKSWRNLEHMLNFCNYITFLCKATKSTHQILQNGILSGDLPNIT